MKKLIITTIALLAVAMSASAQNQTPQGGNKSYDRKGDTFVQTRAKRSSASSNDQVTAYKWRDSKGNEYPIVLHTYAKGEKAGRTTAYVVRTSSKTGKEYKYYLPDGEAIAAEILKENQ